MKDRKFVFLSAIFALALTSTACSEKSISTSEYTITQDPLDQTVFSIDGGNEWASREGELLLDKNCRTKTISYFGETHATATVRQKDCFTRLLKATSSHG